MYGLLDCTVQLAKAFGPGDAPLELRQTLQRLAYESNEEHFRWKAVSLLIEVTGRPRADSSCRLNSFCVK